MCGRQGVRVRDATRGDKPNDRWTDWSVSARVRWRGRQEAGGRAHEAVCADQRAALAEALREVQHAVAVVRHELVEQLDEAHLAAHILYLHAAAREASGQFAAQMNTTRVCIQNAYALVNRVIVKSNSMHIRVGNCSRRKTNECIYRAARIYL